MLIAEFLSGLMKTPPLAPQPPQRSKEQKCGFSESTTVTTWLSLLFQDVYFARYFCPYCTNKMEALCSAWPCADYFKHSLVWVCLIGMAEATCLSNNCEWI